MVKEDIYTCQTVFSKSRLWTQNKIFSLVYLFFTTLLFSYWRHLFEYNEVRIRGNKWLYNHHFLLPELSSSKHLCCFSFPSGLPMVVENLPGFRRLSVLRPHLCYLLLCQQGKHPKAVSDFSEIHWFWFSKTVLCCCKILGRCNDVIRVTWVKSKTLNVWNWIVTEVTECDMPCW